MIEQVRIRNLGVIADAVLDLAPGLTVLTGETGAGKTMVFRGLDLVFGGKADAAVVAHGSDQATVEVDAVAPPHVLATVDELGGQADGDVVIVARQVNRTGRSRSFVGGTSVPAAAVAEIGAELVAVHGQSDQVRLTKPAAQRQLLDRFGGAPLHAAAQAYHECWDEVAQLTRRIESLTTDTAARERELEHLQRVLAAFDELRPEPGEDEVLADESRRLQFSEALHAAAAAGDAALSGGSEGEPGALSLLAQGRKAVEREAVHDPALAALVDRMRELEVIAADVSADLAGYLDGIDASPQRQQYVEERRAALRSLAREFGTVDDVITWVEVNRPRAAELAGGDEVLAQLRADLEAADARLVSAAAVLTERRTAAAGAFAAAVSAELEGLAMSGAGVAFTISPCAPGPSGADTVELGLQSRPGSPWVPLSKGASGGELSRIMLAVEVVLAAADPIGTFIFDEVDAGVGGAAAVEVGKRLARLARTAQVVVVTHLPQVAAFADRHLVVSRSTQEQVHSSSIREVAGDERVGELSRMLAGLADSQAGESLAVELLAVAREHAAG